MTNTSENVLKPNVRQAWEFLNWLSPSGPHRVETIVSEGQGRLGVRTFVADDYEAFARFVEDENSPDTKRNLYFLASAPFLTGNRAKENIPVTNILQVDIDSKDFSGTESEKLEQAISLVLDPNVRPKGVPAPTAVCFTGGGYQAFWKLREPIETALAEELNASLIAVLNGDVGTHDVSHLMRLPGGVNWLNDNKRAKGRQPALSLFIEPANTKKPPVLHEVADFRIKRQKPGFGASGQKLADDIEAVGEPEPLPDDMSEIFPSDPKWAEVLMTGDDPPGKVYRSRSELVHAFTIRMLSHGMKPGHLLSILTDPAFGISAHILDQPKPLAYAKRQVASAQAYLLEHADETGADGKPEILILPGQLPFAVSRAERALIDAGVPVYQRYDSLVRVVKLPDGNSEDGIRRDNGALILKPIATAWLRERFAIVASWVKVNAKGAKVAADPPPDAANVYLARAGEWEVPFLQAVTQIPTLRTDGSILQEPGYDPRSAILYDPGTVEYQVVPENPSKEEAQAALELLFKPFRDFCFARPVDRSVAMAAVLTALVRRMFPSAPLFIIEAPTAGTGKSLFCETLGIIAMGHKPAMMSQGKTSEEQEKRLSSVLMAGDPVIVIDNCDRPIEGDFLCSMLTQEWVQPRILGRSEMLRLPTRNLVVATGNNPEVAGDVTRRTLKCRLDAQVERPDQLQYDFDPRDEAYADRAKLVVAGLTVMRAYIFAGRPMPLDKIGSFEQWNVVREALVWLGMPDPTETRQQIFDDDPRKGELIDLLRLWWKAFVGERLTLSDLYQPSLIRTLAPICVGRLT
ncbi:DNA-primase RepB domain-containing protein [Pararhizobium gei]|uniref:DNA-primase RepB domain-containing protein n=1 Tax=Pararhizobium gei TaxID=1395951 RepID=UPI0023D9F81B|nr:DNA-primase RepB domain-containing protein [Rhizobium gei]